jgi:hypothetical protein
MNTSVAVGTGLALRLDYLLERVSITSGGLAAVSGGRDRVCLFIDSSHSGLRRDQLQERTMSGGRQSRPGAGQKGIGWRDGYDHHRAGR